MSIVQLLFQGIYWPFGAPLILLLVFHQAEAHPQTGNALDRSKVTKRFKEACVDAKVHTIRFHDLRHTFGTRLAASGQPMRMIQEFLGHADSKTTQIYTHYAPSEHEVRIVNEAFAPKAETEGPEEEQVPASEEEQDGRADG